MKKCPLRTDIDDTHYITKCPICGVGHYVNIVGTDIRDVQERLKRALERYTGKKITIAKGRA